MIAENTTFPSGDLPKVFHQPGLTAANFDEVVLNDAAAPEGTKPRLKVVYFWGNDCPNCGAAKDHLNAMVPELSSLPVDFYSVNAYEHMDLVNRFGLYGIPVFLFFKKGRLIGRIPSFPTRAEFLSALRRYV